MDTDNRPVVSVILPTYNRKNLVGKAIQSVLEQNYRNLELIIIDDASTDGTEEIIKEFKDARILYLRNPVNRGGGAARNTGIKVAKGSFIAFQDSDDLWLPDKLEKQMAVFKVSPENVGVVYTQCDRREGDQVRRIPGEHTPQKNGDLFKGLLSENFITLPTVVIKKVCLEKVGGFDESLPRLQDWEFFIRIARYFEFQYIPEPLVYSFFTPGSISSKPEALIRALEIILEKNLAEYKADPVLYAGRLIGLANLYRLERNSRKSRQYLFEAFKVNYRAGLLVAILSSFLGSAFYDFYWELMSKAQEDG